MEAHSQKKLLPTDCNQLLTSILMVMLQNEKPALMS